VIGASLAGVAFLVITVITCLCIKRRQRLRLQQAEGNTADFYRLPAARGINTAQRTVTPFILPVPFLNTTSQSRAPLTNLSSSTQLQRRNRPNKRKAPQRHTPSALSEGHPGETLTEMIQNMQQQLLRIQGHLLGERGQASQGGDRRTGRTSASQSGDRTFETRSEGRSDAPPTYRV
jgi:hypothetical protein